MIYADCGETDLAATTAGAFISAETAIKKMPVPLHKLIKKLVKDEIK